jgi:hypothetical protein
MKAHLVPYVVQGRFMFLTYSKQNTFHPREQILMHKNITARAHFLNLIVLKLIPFSVRQYVVKQSGRLPTLLVLVGCIALVLSSSLQRNAFLSILPHRPLISKSP